MALYKQDELPVLNSASDVKTVAEGAPLEAEKMAIAKLINSAANTGQFHVLYNHDISDDMLTVLETEGYTVKQRSKIISATPEYQYIISWNEA